MKYVTISWSQYFLKIVKENLANFFDFKNLGSKISSTRYKVLNILGLKNFVNIWVISQGKLLEEKLAGAQLNSLPDIFFR